MTIVTHDEYSKMTKWFRRELQKFQLETPPHLRHATKLTKYGERDYTNHKSFFAANKAVKAVKSNREVDVIERLSEDNLAVSAV